ncbi:MAG: folylpolyglutamate synthase/dihydrofolate synthase family protein [Desulfobacteraceae bacterium]|jgi:dihydrofolate synthase/folylpolyglutamate synthase
MKKKISYDDAIQYLYGLQKYGIKFGLSKTSNLLNAFGNPHHGQKYIHVAGTNGKGSVAAMVESILLRSGLKVGFYSSPHLVRFTERFRINAQEIIPEEAAVIAGEVMSMIDPRHPPTFFEVTTAMALIHFARQKTDISIMEVGMGGRLDATNVIRPTVTVITNISLEHRFFLGTHLRDIAREKAGIIKRGVDLITAATQAPVVEIFKRTCERKKAPFWRIGKEIRYRRSGLTFNYYGLKRHFSKLELGLSGGYQSRNAALALAVVELLERKGFEVSYDDIREGLRHANWPGRMHIVSTDPFLVLDGAHNPAAIRHLADSLRSGFQYRRLILVLGVMGDKDIRKILRGIVPIADYVIYTRPEYYRAATPETLMKEAASLGKPGETRPQISRALRKAREIADPKDLILVTGSLFTVGEALTCLDPERYRPDNIRQVIP